LIKLFKTKSNPIESDKQFWDWFTENQQSFYKAVKNTKNIEKDFLDKLSEKLNQLHENIWFLAGMFDDTTAELVLTPDGDITNIAFIEALVMAAPTIPGWKFTALKQAMDSSGFSINMKGYVFDAGNIWFYSNEHPDYPDEVDITIVYNNYSKKDKAIINNGIAVFLENYIGELFFATAIDNLSILPVNEAQKELIAIDKLKSYLVWREKEFVEKYDGIRYDTKDDKYSSLTAELENGKPLIAIINTTLLNFSAKASHPWVVSIEINYGNNSINGMPSSEMYQLLDAFEDELMLELKDFEGYLNIGRQTADNTRTVYFACKDFRKPSKILYHLSKKYAKHFGVSYDIYKDKYWQTFNKFRVS